MDEDIEQLSNDIKEAMNRILWTTLPSDVTLLIADQCAQAGHAAILTVLYRSHFTEAYSKGDPPEAAVDHGEVDSKGDFHLLDGLDDVRRATRKALGIDK